jgi:hypothetical protein
MYFIENGVIWSSEERTVRKVTSSVNICTRRLRSVGAITGRVPKAYRHCYYWQHYNDHRSFEPSCIRTPSQFQQSENRIKEALTASKYLATKARECNGNKLLFPIVLCVTWF